MFVGILWKCEGDRDLIYLCCGALLNLGLNSENQSKFAEADDYPLLINIFRTYGRDRNAIFCVCSALVNLTEKLGIHSIFKFTEICHSLVEILNNREEDREVILSGCGILWNLTINDENQYILGHAGFGSFLVEILRT